MKPNSDIKTNSSEIIQQTALASCGIALRSTWQIRQELLDKKLVHILKDYREAPGIAIYALYPCKQYVPAKLRAFVDFLSSIYGTEPYWDEGLNLSNGKQGKKRNASSSDRAIVANV
jgi:DNA-binding transcriptional LysR family regulator